MLRIKTIKRWERNFNQWYSDKYAYVCVRVWLQNEFIKMNVCSLLAIIFYSFIVKYEVKLKQISHSTESNYRLHICFGKTIVMLLHSKRFQRRGRERICTLSSWFRCSKPHVCSFRYFIRFFAKSTEMCEWMFIWWWGRERKGEKKERDGERERERRWAFSLTLLPQGCFIWYVFFHFFFQQKMALGISIDFCVIQHPNNLCVKDLFIL